MTLIECVPNFSEGRNPDVIAAIADAIAAEPGVSVLDVSSDPWHNRSVITFVAPPEVIVRGAFAGVRAALDRIDLGAHEGVHPRIGAADVVPFVPLAGATMEQCVLLARELGARVGGELGIPVYLYERAATRPDRVSLADVRRGGFEGLRDAIERDPARAPDFGPSRLHPTFGAVAIGARPVLVAYNVYLGPASNLEIARHVAREVRESSGGVAAIKALGLVVDEQAQVSMNLVDLDRTTLHEAWEAVRAAAARYGVEPTWSEIVGLVPERAVAAAAAHALRIARFGPERLLENRIRAVIAPDDEPPHANAAIARMLDAIGAATPAPAGGFAAAHTGALGAALARMVAAITAGKPRYAEHAPRMKAIALRAEELMRELSAIAKADAEVYPRVAAAFRLPDSPAAAAAERIRAIDAALLAAAEIPLAAARASAEAADLAADAATFGHLPARSDAAVGAVLAEASCRAAALTVKVNVDAMSDPASATSLRTEATQLAERAAVSRKRALRGLDR